MNRKLYKTLFTNFLEKGLIQKQVLLVKVFFLRKGLC